MFWGIGFFLRLRSNDVIYEGGNGLVIEPNFGISAELNKLRCCGGDRLELSEGERAKAG